MPRARLPVTPHEAELIKQLPAAVAATETFYISGEVRELDQPMPLLLYTVPRDDGSNEARMLSLKAPSTDDLDALYSASQPSDFGNAGELVHDESYRLARELTADRIGFNFDPVSSQSRILAAVSSFCKTAVVEKLYKLNCYVEGGHFKLHRDTPKAENHIGTLLVGIPVPYSGGELILRHGDASFTVDWSTEGRRGNSDFLWTFFFSDVEHEILPVTSGHRLTISYDIYSSTEVSYKADPTLRLFDPTSSQLYQLLVRVMKDRDFLPKGGKLAFGLSYEYPHGLMEMGELAAQLKGSDHILRQTLQALGVPCAINAVYKPTSLSMIYDRHQGKLYQSDDPESYVEPNRRHEYEIGPVGTWKSLRDRPFVDEFSCLRKKRDERWKMTSLTILLTSVSFGRIHSDSNPDGDQDMVDVLWKGGADARWDYIWVNYPKSFVQGGAVTTYGNQPETAYTYMSGALVAEFPPVEAVARTALM